VLHMLEARMEVDLNALAEHHDQDGSQQSSSISSAPCRWAAPSPSRSTPSSSRALSFPSAPSSRSRASQSVAIVSRALHPQGFLISARRPPSSSCSSSTQAARSTSLPCGNACQSMMVHRGCALRSTLRRCSFIWFAAASLASLTSSAASSCTILERAAWSASSFAFLTHSSGTG